MLPSFLTKEVSAFIPEIRSIIEKIYNKAQLAGIGDLRAGRVTGTISKVKKSWIITLSVYVDGIQKDFVEVIDE